MEEMIRSMMGGDDLDSVMADLERMRESGLAAIEEMRFKYGKECMDRAWDSRQGNAARDSATVAAAYLVQLYELEKCLGHDTIEMMRSLLRTTMMSDTLRDLSFLCIMLGYDLGREEINARFAMAGAPGEPH